MQSRLIFKNTVINCCSLVFLKLTHFEWQIDDKSEIHLNVKIKEKQGKKKEERNSSEIQDLKIIQVYKFAIRMRPIRSLLKHGQESYM